MTGLVLFLRALILIFQRVCQPEEVQLFKIGRTPMRLYLRILVCAALHLSLCSQTSLLAQNEICATISWDDNNLVTWEIDYDISSTQFASAFQSMDQNTGALSGTTPFGVVGFSSWFNLGDVFCDTYSAGNDGAFWDGFNGIISSDPNLGIAPDADTAPDTDDLFLVAQSLPLTSGQGSFTLTIPMNSDPALCYNVGSYVSNDGLGKITVVPEPSTGLLFSLAGVCLGLAARRRRR